MERRRPVLVAGRAGQLARCLVDAAGRRGLSLVALGRPELDIEDADMVSRAVASVVPRAIINAAAYNAVDLAESEPERAVSVNRDGAARLAAAAGKLRIPHVYVSTDYVFDGSKPSPYAEHDPPSPLGVYGRSKVAGENAVRDACPGAVVLRTSWLYSRYGENFVKTMLRLAEVREVVRVVDDQRGAPTTAGDLASAILDLTERMIATAGDSHAGTYHLTAAGETTWHGFAVAIFAGWQRRGQRVPKLEAITTADYPTLARRPANSRLDCGRIERAFGIRLAPWATSLEICLDELLAVRVAAPSC